MTLPRYTTEVNYTGVATKIDTLEALRQDGLALHYVSPNVGAIAHGGTVASSSPHDIVRAGPSASNVQVIDKLYLTTDATSAEVVVQDNADTPNVLHRAIIRSDAREPYPYVRPPDSVVQSAQGKKIQLTVDTGNVFFSHVYHEEAWSPYLLVPTLWIDTNQSGKLFKTTGLTENAGNGDKCGYVDPMLASLPHFEQTSSSASPTVGQDASSRLVLLGGSGIRMSLVNSVTYSGDFTIYLRFTRTAPSTIILLGGSSSGMGRITCFGDNQTYFSDNTGSSVNAAFAPSGTVLMRVTRASGVVSVAAKATGGNLGETTLGTLAGAVTFDEILHSLNGGYGSSSDGGSAWFGVPYLLTTAQKTQVETYFIGAAIP